MDQLTIAISREESTDEGTYGILRGEGLTLQTLELPWCDNEPGHSCIPCGQYPCAVTYSPKFNQDLYELFEVPGRGNVRIHSGNLAGDVRKGLHSDVEGCILLGLERGIHKGQKAVLSSRDAVKLFMNTMKGREFILCVQ